MSGHLREDARDLSSFFVSLYGTTSRCAHPIGISLKIQLSKTATNVSMQTAEFALPRTLLPRTTVNGGKGGAGAQRPGPSKTLLRNRPTTSKKFEGHGIILSPHALLAPFPPRFCQAPYERIRRLFLYPAPAITEPGHGLTTR